MVTLEGRYNKAKVFTDTLEKETISQIIGLCNEEFAYGSKIRIMPDAHVGIGCVIGTTMTITDKIVPNLVGVDIGCGVLLQKIAEKDINLQLLDEAIYANVPSGQNVRTDVHELAITLNMEKFLLDNLRCKSHVDMNRALLSIGTLGGGNHFIELNKDSQGNIYIVIHTGSRYLGKQVATYYQDLAFQRLSSNRAAVQQLINELKAAGREKDIQRELASIKPLKVSKDFAFLQGQDLEDYIHDVDVVQYYAHINRISILKSIMESVGLTLADLRVESVHNYISTEEMILRKGAIAAHGGQYVVVPINMRDGSIIGIGKGDVDWNSSAPHGAGRLMSRSAAKGTLSLVQYANEMQGIYSTSVNASTLDEAPMAYKPIKETLENIRGTVDIIEVIKPIYSFKSSL